MGQAEDERSAITIQATSGSAVRFDRKRISRRLPCACCQPQHRPPAADADSMICGRRLFDSVRPKPRLSRPVPPSLAMRAEAGDGSEVAGRRRFSIEWAMARTLHDTLGQFGYDKLVEKR